MSRRVNNRASRACAAAATGLVAAFSITLPSAAAPPSAAVGATAPDVAAADDIRDIRGPKGILPPWLLPALLAGVVLLLTAAFSFCPLYKVLGLNTSPTVPKRM